jgi:hypothetical protein
VGETTAAGGAYVNVKVNPSGALAVDLDAIEDSLTDYHFYAWEVDTNVYYLGYQTKSAAWYAKKIDPAAGTCLYASGGSSPPTPANLSAQSYDSCEATF